MRMNKGLAIALALGALGAADTYGAPRNHSPELKKDPIRDASRIKEAEGKRAKKAAKRARMAARNAGVKP